MCMGKCVDTSHNGSLRDSQATANFRTLSNPSECWLIGSDATLTVATYASSMGIAAVNLKTKEEDFNLSLTRRVS
jgi:hypothetical protein